MLVKIEQIRLQDDNDQVTLTTYVLEDSAEMLGGARRPAVLILPGGGYIFCSDREAEPVAMAFATAGYHAFVLRYSVYGLSDQMTNLEPRAHSPHPRPLIDVALAMREINDRAEEWGVDTERIAVAGFSAGGHNAAMYGAYWDKPLVTDVIGEPLRPAALILGYAISDFTDLVERLSTRSEFEIALYSSVLVAFFGSTTPSDDELKAASPAPLADGSFPPSFIWATGADMVVPPQQSLIMAQRLADLGVPNEVHLFEEGRHGLSLATQATASGQGEIEPRVATWFEQCTTWLAKRFALPVPERSRWERA
ncbi:MAG: alpha/beta hydrolase [Acidimicrobiia bacterium]